MLTSYSINCRKEKFKKMLKVRTSDACDWMSSKPIYSHGDRRCITTYCKRNVTILLTFLKVTFKMWNLHTAKTIKTPLQSGGVKLNPVNLPESFSFLMVSFHWPMGVMSQVLWALITPVRLILTIWGDVRDTSHDRDSLTRSEIKNSAWDWI